MYYKLYHLIIQFFFFISHTSHDTKRMVGYIAGYNLHDEDDDDDPPSIDFVEWLYPNDPHRHNTIQHTFTFPEFFKGADAHLNAPYKVIGDERVWLLPVP